MKKIVLTKLNQTKTLCRLLQFFELDANCKKSLF